MSIQGFVFDIDRETRLLQRTADALGCAWDQQFDQLPSHTDRIAIDIRERLFQEYYEPADTYVRTGS